MKIITIFILLSVFLTGCMSQSKEAYEECPNIELVFSIDTTIPGAMCGHPSMVYAFLYKGKDTVSQQLKFVIDNEGAYNDDEWRSKMRVLVPPLDANEGVFIDWLRKPANFKDFETPKILQISELNSSCYVKLSSSFKHCRRDMDCLSQFKSILKANNSDRIYLLLHGKWHFFPIDFIQNFSAFGANS